MPRYFTLSEARQHLPALDSGIREAIAAKKVLEAAERDRRELTERVMMVGGVSLDREKAIDARNKRESSAAALKRVFEHFEEVGCVIKDLDIGLIDFPALYRGREVYLCWQLGEPDIAFWHAVEEGFAGRQPIDRDFLRECG